MSQPAIGMVYLIVQFVIYEGKVFPFSLIGQCLNGVDVVVSYDGHESLTVEITGHKSYAGLAFMHIK